MQSLHERSEFAKLQKLILYIAICNLQILQERCKKFFAILQYFLQNHLKPCKNNGFLLYQAHPYRNGATPQNPEYLHGVEINCHPLYKTSEEKKVRKFAEKNNLRLSCGADFHGDTYKPRCGMYIPDYINDGVGFAEYLKTHTPRLLLHDIIVLK